jgi:hypothetical protein
MNIETRPNAQTPPGKARNALNAAKENSLFFDDGVFNNSLTVLRGSSLSHDIRSVTWVSHSERTANRVLFRNDHV